ncbi:MAG: hypothetical protein JXB04_09065 [Kiritimatiellae bacterium]|nr:hypothetical protein [Kiritimatiellia bacterium]
MSASILIGRLLAVVYLFAGLGFLVRPAYYRKMLENMLTNYAMLYLSGIMATVIGALIVMYHNTWSASWTVIITIIGWLALIKGASLVILPDLALKKYEKMLKNEKLIPVYGIIALVFAAVLGWFSLRG